MKVKKSCLKLVIERIEGLKVLDKKHHPVNEFLSSETKKEIRSRWDKLKKELHRTEQHMEMIRTITDYRNHLPTSTLLI